MCQRGRWRGFHTRYLKTPDGQESPLVVMEQCTECSSYRARDLEGFPFVTSDDSQEKERQENNSGSDLDLSDPEAEDGGSVWGPGSSSSSDDGW